MTDQIAHRGPDDAGIYISPERNVGLGFRRLSIIDLSAAGHQPMTNDDGSIWIVFNGEIYNHRDIRNDLEKKGYKYRSQTDTETILYAYQEYGLGFINKLYGMFAIGIWDSREQQLLLVRDRIGIKPVYYTTQNGALFFGSEIKSLLQHPSVNKEVNNQALYDYLTLFMSPPDETLFQGIHKLEAGHYLLVDRTGNLRKEKYWDVNHHTEEFEPESFNDEQFCVDNIRRLLRDSIRLRMMADVPFGVLLSGGIDSSLNVALMSELMDRPVETFSVGYKSHEQYNELGYARQIADLYKTNHHEVIIDENDALEFLPKMIWHLDEPNADNVCVPLYFVSKLARENNTIVVQVGEGSDEEFSGYTPYARELQYRKYYYNMLPRFVHSAGYRLLQTVKPESMLTDYARRAYRKDASFYGNVVGFSEELKPLLLQNQFIDGKLDTGRIPRRYNNQYAEIFSPGDRSPLRQIAHYEFKNRLAELLLMRVDKISMSVSIEARVPFLDHRLVEFAFRIPDSLRIKNGQPKYILKKAAEGILPNEIIYRQKQGFNAPAVEWLRTGELKSYAYDRVMQSALMKQGMFKKDFIERLFSQHIERKSNHAKQLWTLLIVCMWYDQHFT